MVGPTNRVEFIADTLRRTARGLGVALLLLACSVASAVAQTVTTDKRDYEPGETVTVTLTGFTAYTSFQVPVIRPDGNVVTGDGTFTPGWDWVTTGASGDAIYSYTLNGIIGRYGVRVHDATWNPGGTVDSSDPVFSEAPVASVIFFDGPNFNFDFAAAAPLSYPHSTGGGAFDDRTVGIDKDVQEQLTSSGSNFACGDKVTFFTEVDFHTMGSVPSPSTLRLTYEFDRDDTHVAYAPYPSLTTPGTYAVSVNRGTIVDLTSAMDPPGTLDNQVDDGNMEDGGSVISAQLVTVAQNPPSGRKGDVDVLTFQLSDVEVGERIIVRIDATLSCDGLPPTNSNIQAKMTKAERCTAVNGAGQCTSTSNLPAGSMTVPLKANIVAAGRGTIVITKDTDPDDAQDFAFTTTGGLSPANFSLDDDGTPVNPLSKTQTFSNVLVGTYTVTETAEAGFELTGLSCTGDNDGGTTTDLDTATATIDLDPGETITCTYTNKPKPTLKVTKILSPTTDPGKFDLLIDGIVEATDAGHTGTTGPVTVSIGEHFVSETAGTGTNIANYTTVIAGDCAADGSVTLAAGETGECTITNTFTATAQPTLKVTKVLDPPGDPGVFSLLIDGNVEAADAGHNDMAGPIVVSIDDHTVSELAGTDTDLANYVSVIGGDCDADGTVDVGAGNAKECTITNTRLPIFSKSFSPDPIAEGQTSTLTLTINNTASVNVTDLDFTDTLPAGVLIAATPNAATTCMGGTLTASAGGYTISYNGGSVAAATSCTVSVDVTSDTAGVYDNTSGDLTSSLGNSGTASDTLTVNGPPTFAKIFSPDAIFAGQISMLIFTIDNTASSADVTSLAFTDNLPAGVVVATPNGEVNGCGGTLAAVSGGTNISYSGGSVLAGESCTVVVDVTSDTADVYDNTSGDLTSSAGNSGPAMDTLTVNPLPTFAKSFSPDSIFVGQTSTLTFTIDNSASSAGVSGLNFSDTLPANVLIAATPNAATTCTGGTLTANAGTSTISYSGGSLAADTSCTVTVDVTSSTVGDHLNTSDNLTSSAGNSGPASDTLTVNPAADLALDKSDDGTDAVGGLSYTYTLKVTNNGPSDSTGGTLSDTLPEDWSFVSSTNGTCVGDGLDPETVSCAIGALAVGGMQTFTVTVAVPTDVLPGLVTNTATVTGNEEDLVPNNNTDTEDTDVIAGVLNAGVPGSALIVPFTLESNSPTNISVLRITNNDPNEDVRVHLVRVCAAEKSFGGEGFCEASNREVTLTHNETRVVNIRNFFGIDPAACETGYVLAYAVDPTQGPGQPISWNQLTGSIYVRGPGGPGLNWTMGAQGYTVQSPQPRGTAIGSGGPFPQLPFDGIDYRQLPTVSQTDFVAASGPRSSALWLLTLDIQAGAQNPPTVVAVDWWNEAEDLFSTSHEYVCHTRVPLTELSHSFTQGGLGSFYGNLQVTPWGADAVIGFIEEVEPNRRTFRPLYHDNVPRMTTFTGR